MSQSPRPENGPGAKYEELTLGRTQVPEHLTEQDLERFRSRSLRADELAATSEHLMRCPGCQARLGGSELLEPAYHLIRAELAAAGNDLAEHLTFEQLSSYAGDRLDRFEREVAETHLEVCPMCHEEVRDLQLIEQAVRHHKAYEPASDASAEPSRAATFRRAISTRSTGRNRVLLKVAAMLALFAIALVAWRLISVTSQLRSQIVELQASNDRLREDLEATQTALNEFESENAGLWARLDEMNGIEGRKPERLVPPSSGTLLPATVPLSINDGSRKVTVDRYGRVEGIGSVPLVCRELIGKAFSRGRPVTPPHLAALNRRSGSLMGSTGPRSFSLIAPLGTFVESENPTLRWQPHEGASAYLVTIRDAALTNVLVSPDLPETEWRVPAGLKRGSTYSWQVKAIVGSKEIVSPPSHAAEATFRIMSAAEAGRLRRLEQRCGDSRLSRAVLFADAGLLDEAERELQLVVDANRGVPELEALLRNLTSVRRPAR